MNKFILYRQKAGDLVKECRSWMVRRSGYDTPYERKLKNDLRKQNTPICRNATDRMELYLAMIGKTGVVYTLTFSSQHLPDTYKKLRKVWTTWSRKMRRKIGGDAHYLYRIEGLHGDHRYHFHVVIREEELSLDEMQQLWNYGIVDQQRLIRGTAIRPAPAQNPYREWAVYLTKENQNNDTYMIPVGARPWSASRALHREWLPLEKASVQDGLVTVPNGAKITARSDCVNTFGETHYVSYILQ